MLTSSKCVLVRSAGQVAARSSLTADTAVLLLGWGHARDEHLAKYSEIYEQRGFTTLRYTAPFSLLQVLNLRRKRDISPFLENFDKLSESHPRLLIHVFSMNGCYTLSSMIFARGAGFLENADAIVMDSCPIEMYPPSRRAFSLAVRDILKKLLKDDSTVFQATSALLLATITAFVRLANLWMWFHLKLGTRTQSTICPTNFFQTLENFPRRQLYFYSRKDHICPSGLINEFIESQEKERGARTRRVLFADSPHCGHLRVYPKEYADALDQLLEDVEKVRV